MQKQKWLFVMLVALGLALPHPVLSVVVPNLKLEEIPAQQLIDNINAHLIKNPKDHEAVYELARVYSVLYASDKPQIVGAFKNWDGEPLRYGVLFPDASLAGPHRTLSSEKVATRKPLTDAQKRYFSLSLQHYQKAITLVEENKIGSKLYPVPFYLLGYAWMLEEGMNYANTLPAPFKPDNQKATKQEWHQVALKFYRRAFKENFISTRKVADTLLNFTIPEEEAAQAIVRLEKDNPDPTVKKEVTKLRNLIARMRRSAISPIIFPLGGRLPLSSLVAPEKRVHFDLMGSGTKDTWSWVNRKAGILVWDPLHTGNIRSGQQLFGNVTWCMVWRHGYQPLSRLDNNHDGYLSGKELEGLAVWCDQNGNGASDRGEVIPLQKLGIVRIAVTGYKRAGIWMNSRGILLQNGTSLPTYDWIAKEAPQKTKRGS